MRTSVVLLLILALASAACARPAAKPTPKVQEKIEFQDADVRYFAPGKPPTANVYGRNVLAATLDVWRLPALPATLDEAKPYAGRAPSFRTTVRFYKSRPTHEFYVQKPITLPLKDVGVYLVRLRAGKDTSDRIVCITPLYLVTKLGPGQMLVYAGDATRGTPMAQVDLTVYRSDNLRRLRKVTSARTGADGTALISVSAEEARYVVIGHRGGAFNRNDADYQPPPPYKVYVYTDRPVYRPGHTVSYKAIVRRLVPGTNRYENVPNRKINVEVHDSVGSRLVRSEAVTNENGTLWGQYGIAPTEPPLGQYALVFGIGGQLAYGAFKVEEYRKPEFTVLVTPAAPYTLTGRSAEFDVSARYFFNSPVAGAKFTYSVYAKPFQPPAMPEPGFDENYLTEPGVAEGRVVEPERGGLVIRSGGKLDEAGRAHLSIPTKAGGYTHALSVQVEVTDPGNRVQSGTAEQPVTTSTVYLAAAPDQRIYAKGETMHLKVRAQGFDGRPKSVPVVVLVGAHRYVEGREIYVVATQATGRTDANGFATVSLKAPGGGQYSATVQAIDEGGRKAETSTAVWVAEKDAEMKAHRWPDLKIVTERSMMRPGEEARLLVITAAKTGSVLLTLEGDRIHRHLVLPVRNHMAMTKIPITAAMLPTLHLGAVLIGARGDALADSASMGVRADQNFLEVRMAPDKKEYRPGEKGSVTVTTLDAGGRPLPAEVSLGVVDEAIYQISPDLSSPIRRFFWGFRPNAVTTVKSQALVYSAGEFQRVGGATRIRRVFLDTASWTPSVVTGADGTARVDFTYPDNLTTWRITSVGVTNDTRVGRSLDKTLVRKPFMVRLGLPRFAVRGDETELATFVHNETGAPQQVNVSLKAANLQLQGPSQQTVEVKAGEMKTLRWPVKHEDSRDATVTAVATTRTQGVDDGVEQGVRGIPWGLPQTARSAGLLKGGQSQSVALTAPAAFDDAAGGVVVHLSPGVPGLVASSADWLAAAVPVTSEEAVSAFYPLVTAGTAQKLLGLPTSIPPERLARRVQDGIATLYGWQKNTGGWAWVSDGQPYSTADPYATAWVLEGLAAARSAGYLVDDAKVSRAYDYLLGEATRTRNPGQRAVLVAALSTRGPAAAHLLDGLFASRKQLDYYAQAALILALVRSGRGEQAREAAADLVAVVHDVDGQAHWETDPEKFGWTDSATETTAMAMRALIAATPDSPLIDNAARWLALRRERTSWSTSTRTTALAVIGLAEWMLLRKDSGAAVQVQATLNGEQVGQWDVQTGSREAPARVGKGALPQGQEIVARIPSAKLKPGPNTLMLRSSGGGNVFWNVASELYPQGKEPGAATDRGMAMHREYYKRVFNYDDKGNLTYRYEPVDRVVKVGEEVLVVLKMASWRSAQYLTIEDPVPAGFEVYNQEPADLYPKGYQRDYISRVFYRDQKVVFYQDHAEPRIYQYMYLMRATTPGRYGVNPGRIRLVYYPSVQGTTSSTVLEVQP